MAELLFEENDLGPTVVSTSDPQIPMTAVGQFLARDFVLPRRY